MGVGIHARAQAHSRKRGGEPAARGRRRRHLPSPRSQDGLPAEGPPSARRDRRHRGQQPALDAGPDMRRARRGGRPRIQPPRHERRGIQRQHPRDAQVGSAGHHRRRRRRRLDGDRGAPRPHQEHHGRLRRDDDRHQAAARDGERGRPALPDARRQRRAEQAPFRQPLRHGPVRLGRDTAHDEPHSRGQKRRRRGLRLVRQGDGEARGRPRRARHSRRGRPAQGARSAHGRLRGHEHERRCEARRRLCLRDRKYEGHPPRAF